MSEDANFEFIDDDELENLREVLEHPANERDVEDPIDLVPNRPGQNRNFTERQSKAIVLHSEESSIRKTADKLGISRTTVVRHRSYWLDNDQHDAVCLSGLKGVNDRLCGAMRMACHHGDTLEEVAQRWDVSIATVSNHVSASRKGKCSHDPPVEIERVDFEYGGLYGEEEKRVCADCGFVSNIAEHECAD